MKHHLCRDYHRKKDQLKILREKVSHASCPLLVFTAAMYTCPIIHLEPQSFIVIVVMEQLDNAQQSLSLELINFVSSPAGKKS